MIRSVRLAAVIAGCLLGSCGRSSAPNAGPAKASAAEGGRVPEPFRITSVFPVGPGRDKVLNACGSCHGLACVTRGQRSAERWESVKKGHNDKLTDLSRADLNEMFSYLTANFNETKLEPQIPAELLQQGCTPF